MAAATRPALSSARTQIVRRVPSSVFDSQHTLRGVGWGSLLFATLTTHVLTSRIGSLSQCGKFCAFRNRANSSEQADHEDAAESPAVVDGDFDFREVVERAEAVEEVCEDVAGCDWKKKVSQTHHQTTGQDRSTHLSAYKNSPH